MKLKKHIMENLVVCLDKTLRDIKIRSFEELDHLYRNECLDEALSEDCSNIALYLLLSKILRCESNDTKLLDRYLKIVDLYWEKKHHSQQKVIRELQLLNDEGISDWNDKNMERWNKAFENI